MRATKESILHYLIELKAEFSKDGITTFALFGSFAKDTHGVYSDIDVAIAKRSDYLSHNSSYSYFETISKIKDKIRKKFHRNIDIFDLDSQSPFKETIQKELIYV
ncbi:MAG: nucleotidyltransferase domain-containing protein [Sulfurimonas sp.]|uniref:nucleotidyltransferase family protein n=1 Tax=Sulfurimonas sp. TaxID=2022749 RepID=UPI002623DB2C|nr:nucleotidyltransferase domain-containing protein [Sulfurimonas sp.]MDD5400986.1 nucleotidyltransferase domain-containing protein [Sulfurimonas sp.]